MKSCALLANLAVHYKDNVYRLRSRINSEEKSSSWEDNSCPVRESHVSNLSADESLRLSGGAIEQKCRESQLAVCQRVPL